MDVVAAGVERLKLGLRAQIFLKALQGTFTVTWERPEELQEALLEFMSPQHDHGGIDARLLLSYLDVLRSPLVKMCESEDAGGEPQIQQPERCLKRQKPGENGGNNHAGKGTEGHTAGGAMLGMVADMNGKSASKESAAARVLSDRNLVAIIFDQLDGGTRQEQVRWLGRAASVCRMWRDLAGWEQWWVGTEELLPEVWKDEARGKPHVARQRIFDYGRVLVTERSVWREDDWMEGLELHFEVFDRMDRLRMLSVSGPLAADVNEVRNFTELLIPLGPRVEVRGAAFSVASRDPEHNRFEDIRDFFSRCHLPEFPCSLCVRVMVRDTRTGRMALLWEEVKNAERDWAALDQGQGLPDSICWVSVPALFTSTHYLGTDMRGSISFHVCDEEGDEGEEVDPREELWRLVGGEEGYEAHCSPITFILYTADAGKVGAVIRRMLNPPTGEVSAK